jgi:ribosome maturation factor RimP|uniref:Ribosome maturation factor RimP n=1 Tax=Desulfobacca acetoxidans TaxID=60893 RepID=A0A7C5AM72_9BACT
MKTEPEDIAAKVGQLVQPYLTAQGVELVEVEFRQPRRGRATLRLFVDRPGGITLEEITRVSRVVGEILDVHDPIGPSYTLEVSSPGLTREFKSLRDYERYRGRLVRLTTHRPWQGKQVHRGILQGLENGEVTLLLGDGLRRIPLTEIAKARLDIDF